MKPTDYSRIAWHGVDASPDMLARAEAKLTGVDLRQGHADALPFTDGSVSYLSCNFALHHFEDKQAALAEMRRVLAADGALRIVNVAPDRMPGWWVYRIFPEAWVEDQKRFWSAELLRHELQQLGFEVRTRIRVRLVDTPARDLLERARRRDMSSITIVSDECYAAGLAQLEALAAHDARVTEEGALLLCEAFPARTGP